MCGNLLCSKENYWKLLLIPILWSLSILIWHFICTYNLKIHLLMKWPQWSKEDVKYSCLFFWSTLKTSKFDFTNLKSKTNFIINHVLIFNIITTINMMIPIIICLKPLLVIFYFYSNLSGYIIYAITWNQPQDWYYLSHIIDKQDEP